MALQPSCVSVCPIVVIYNSRNCYGFIARNRRKRNFYPIYNSRNCYGFIADKEEEIVLLQSTIVEIVMALQPFEPNLFSYVSIYNSRNCYGFIAFLIASRFPLASTIVEIVMALQPEALEAMDELNLQQQKLLWLYSRMLCLAGDRSDLQQQKLLWLYSRLLNVRNFALYLQQQKLLWLYSHLLRCKYMTIISISRTFILCFWRKNYTPVLHEINECVANLKKYSCLWIVARWYRNKGLSAQKQTTAWS